MDQWTSRVSPDLRWPWTPRLWWYSWTQPFWDGSTLLCFHAWKVIQYLFCLVSVETANSKWRMIISRSRAAPSSSASRRSSLCCSRSSLLGMQRSLTSQFLISKINPFSIGEAFAHTNTNLSGLKSLEVGFAWNSCRRNRQLCTAWLRRQLLARHLFAIDLVIRWSERVRQNPLLWSRWSPKSLRSIERMDDQCGFHGLNFWHRNRFVELLQAHSTLGNPVWPLNIWNHWDSYAFACESYPYSHPAPLSAHQLSTESCHALQAAYSECPPNW